MAFVKAQPFYIPGFSKKYFVTRQGRIVSHRKDGTPFFFRPATNHHGYFYISLGGKKYSLHGIAARAFFGIRPPELVVNHKDGNKKNNSLENLEYCTRSENALHAHRTGLLKSPSGENHWSKRMPEKRYSKLKEADVIKIKYELSKNNSWRKIAKMYNVTKTCIGHIIRGKSWKHL